MSVVSSVGSMVLDVGGTVLEVGETVLEVGGAMLEVGGAVLEAGVMVFEVVLTTLTAGVREGSFILLEVDLAVLDVVKVLEELVIMLEIG